MKRRSQNRMPPGGRFQALGDLRWPSVSPSTLVLLPIGSTEQHGPHLPLATDTVIATELARAVARNLTNTGETTHTVVAPAISYGASGEHQDFPGTVSIGNDCLFTTIVELGRSITSWADRLVIINGHGGNVLPLSKAVGKLHDEGRSVSWTPCGMLNGDAHAGRLETSIMLHLAGNLVEMAIAEVGNTLPLSEILPIIRERGVRYLSPSGILGDPTGASDTEGADLFAHAVANACARIRFAQLDLDGSLKIPPEPASG